MKESEVVQLWLNGGYTSPKEFKESLQIVVDTLKEKNDRLIEAENLLQDAYNMLDDVHCYDTDTYREISKYFNGEDDDK